MLRIPFFIAAFAGLVNFTAAQIVLSYAYSSQQFDPRVVVVQLSQIQLDGSAIVVATCISEQVPLPQTSVSTSSPVEL